MKALVKDPDSIKLGIIGMNEGNGHPYSWSAIINGKYNKKKMTEECPYTMIPEYLNKEPQEHFDINNAEVTHIFCDNLKDAEHVAACSLIPNIAGSPESMAEKVDAVVIATDQGHEHVKRARPFIEAGIPVFIDKPLCLSLEDLAVFRKWHDEGAVFYSSSSRKYSKEYIPYQISTANLGKLEYISTTICKYWETYGIHALESFYSITGPGFESIRNFGDKKKNKVLIRHKSGIDIFVLCGVNIKPGRLILNGREKEVSIQVYDTFYSFKQQMKTFMEYLRTGIRPRPFAETEELMKLIIGGIISREQNGREVLLDELN